MVRRGCWSNNSLLVLMVLMVLMEMKINVRHMTKTPRAREERTRCRHAISDEPIDDLEGSRTQTLFRRSH
jgi:hypothetical protein